MAVYKYKSHFTHYGMIFYKVNYHFLIHEMTFYKIILHLSEDDITFINDTDDLISPNMTAETESKLVEENTDKTGTISLSNVYKDIIPMMPKDSDDEPEMDFAFI